MRIAAGLPIFALAACMSFAASAQPPSGPRAIPENVHKAERDDRMATEPRRANEPPHGLLQYDLDSAYLPDIVGGYIEVAVTDSSTVTAETKEVLREIATLLKEKGDIDVFVTAQLETKSETEARQTALAVQSVVDMLHQLEIEDVPFRIWHPEEKRTEPPMDVLEIRVLTSVRPRQPVS